MKSELSEAVRRDWRNIANRRRIVGSGYADQPYLLKTGDGGWLCCVTMAGIVLFRADGRFCDGGEERQFGWWRFPRDIFRLFRLPEAEINTFLAETMEIRAR